MRPPSKPTLRQLSTDQSTLSTLNITRGSKPTDKETRTSQIYSSLFLKQSTIDSETGRESTSNSTIQPKIQSTDDRKTGRHTTSKSTSQQSTIQSYTMLTTNTTSVSSSGKSLNRRKRKQ